MRADPLDEALAVLGLEPRDLSGLDPKTLRRRYLRKVKEHRPERDPKGFQRVRAAYELISSLLEGNVGLEGSRIEVSTTDGETFVVLPETAARLPLDEVPSPFETSDADLERFEEARSLAANRQAREAADVLESALNALDHPSLHIIASALSTTMLLHAEGAEAEVSRVWPQVEATTMSVRGFLELDEDLVHRYLAAGEILSLPASFPGPLRRAMALAVAHDRLNDANEACHELAESSPQRAQTAFEQLAEAPVLWSYYGHFLETRSVRETKLSGFAVLWVVFILILMFGSRYKPYSGTPTLTFQVPPHLESLDRSIDALCIRGAEAPWLLCDLGRAALVHARIEDCGGIFRRRHELHSMVEASPIGGEVEAESRQLIASIDNVLRERCNWTPSTGAAAASPP